MEASLPRRNFSGCGIHRRVQRGDVETAAYLAASDLQEVSVLLAEEFHAQTGVLVQFNFAASGTLMQQIEAGARPDVFASANVGFVKRLVQNGFIEPGTSRIYAKGRLAIVSARIRIDSRQWRT